MRINEALGKLVDTVYFKLKYIDTAMGAANVLGMLRNDKQGTIALVRLLFRIIWRWMMRKGISKTIQGCITRFP